MAISKQQPLRPYVTALGEEVDTLSDSLPTEIADWMDDNVNDYISAYMSEVGLTVTPTVTNGNMTLTVS